MKSMLIMQAPCKVQGVQGISHRIKDGATGTNLHLAWDELGQDSSYLIAWD